MKADAVLTAYIAFSESDASRDLWRSKRSWEARLLPSSITALIAGAFGLALAAASLLGIVPHHGALSAVSAALLIASLVALVLTAHCLDKVGEIKWQIRMRSYRGKLLDEIKR